MERQLSILPAYKVQGDLQMVKYLVQEHNANVDVTVTKHAQFFARKQDANGMDTSATYFGQSPLTFAAANGKKELVRFLLESGAKD